MKADEKYIYRIDSSIYFYAKDEEDFDKTIDQLDRGTCPPYRFYKELGWYHMDLKTCHRCGFPVETVYSASDFIDEPLQNDGKWIKRV